MRLVDQITQASSPIRVVGSGTGDLPAARSFASALASCTARFVLEASAAERCRALLRTDGGMLAAQNDFLRVPVPEFWLEWPSPPQPGQGVRTGVLVTADRRGRSGSLATFWEQPEGEPVPAEATVEFDLDRDVALWKSIRGFALIPSSHLLAPHLQFLIHPAWLPHLRRQGDEQAIQFIRQIASNLMPAVEMLLVFSALIQERSVLERRAVGYAALNRQRVRRGKPPLLDHVEVRINLANEERQRRAVRTGMRGSPRLHVVRGHMVERGGRTFWRRSHLRGHPAPRTLLRTTSVAFSPTVSRKQTHDTHAPSCGRSPASPAV